MQLLVIFSRRSWAELAAVCRWGRIRMTWGQPPASTPCCCSSRARGCPTQAPGLHTWAEIDVCKWSPLTWTRGIGYLSAWMWIWTQDCRKVASVLQFLCSISFPPSYWQSEEEEQGTTLAIPVLVICQHLSRVNLQVQQVSQCFSLCARLTLSETLQNLSKPVSSHYRFKENLKCVKMQLTQRCMGVW